MTPVFGRYIRTLRNRPSILRSLRRPVPTALRVFQLRFLYLPAQYERILLESTQFRRLSNPSLSGPKRLLARRESELLRLMGSENIYFSPTRTCQFWRPTLSTNADTASDRRFDLLLKAFAAKRQLESG